MARVDIATIKSKFESGDRPTGQDFVDLIDTLISQATDLGTSGNNEHQVTGIENPTVIDTYDSTIWRFVKYIFTISRGDDSHFYATEISILFDGTNLNVSQYGDLDNNGDIGTIDVSRNGNAVNITIIPSSSITPVTVRFARMGLKA